MFNVFGVRVGGLGFRFKGFFVRSRGLGFRAEGFIVRAGGFSVLLLVLGVYNLGFRV